MARSGDGSDGSTELTRAAAWAAVACCLLFGSSAAVAQRIAGRVQLPDSTPAATLGVLIVDSAGKTLARSTTNELGRYAIAWLPHSSRISITRIGARPTVVRLLGVPHDTSIDVMMQPVDVPSLDTVTSQSDRMDYFTPQLQEFETRRAGGVGHFVSDVELRRFDNTSLASVIPSKVPGVRLIWYRSQTFASSIRGGNKRRADPNDARSPVGCWISVAVDGIVIYKGAPFVPPDLGHMQVNEYTGIEYYDGSSTMPPKFAGQDASCGFLLLWTREK
jgi:hypothetical protein